MITIKQPTVAENHQHTRLLAEIVVDGTCRPLWFEVAAAYGRYLCHERADAFLIGVLHWAMAHGHDIVCEAPVDGELLHQITHDLIPALSRNSAVLHASRVEAPLATDTLPNAGAVGTGISCGVDSFHAVATQADAPCPRLRLTHLALYQAGSHGADESGRRLFAQHRSHVESFCREQGFKLVVGDSNIAAAFPENFLYVHTFRAAFAVHALQKLWRAYFYASAGTGAASFDLHRNDQYSSSRYDLLTLPALSTPALRLHAAGLNETRLEKLRVVAGYPPAHRYLNVCGRFPSCNTCRKCKRTLLELYAIGRLDDFTAVFDVAHFRRNLNWYLIRFLSKYWQRDAYYVSLYPLLRDKIPWPVRLAALGRYGGHVLLKRLKRWRRARPITEHAHAIRSVPRCDKTEGGGETSCAS